MFIKAEMSRRVGGANTLGALRGVWRKRDAFGRENRNVGGNSSTNYFFCGCEVRALNTRSRKMIEGSGN